MDRSNIIRFVQIGFSAENSKFQVAEQPVARFPENEPQGVSPRFDMSRRALARGSK